MTEAYKKVGQTPLQLLEEIRRNNSDLSKEILSYAGRLDPIAEGKMLILVGREENQNREKYLHYDKTYQAEILFGFNTDTLDIMGMVLNHANEGDKVDPTNIANALNTIKTLKKIKYPVYSSKTVKGKPLFEWEREGRIKEITIPSRQIIVKKAKLNDILVISGGELLDYLRMTIEKVDGDFRQKQILTKWQNVLTNMNLDISELEFEVARVEFKVSTGTYIRALVSEISREIGMPATLLRLKRTKIHKNLEILDKIFR